MAPLLLTTLLTLALLGCSGEPEPTDLDRVATDSLGPLAAGASETEADTVEVRGVRQAQAQIDPVGGGQARGTITLTQVEGGVRVRAELEGLSSEDYHALQILSGRDCDADPAVHLGADAGAPHGGPYSLPGQRHAGDLGSVRGDDGTGRYDRIDAVLDVSGAPSPVGRAVVVRALRDDASHPDGAAGAVIGCGILEPS